MKFPRHFRDALPAVTCPQVSEGSINILRVPALVWKTFAGVWKTRS
jgi:hypothetical protein